MIDGKGDWYANDCPKVEDKCCLGRILLNNKAVRQSWYVCVALHHTGSFNLPASAVFFLSVNYSTE